METLIFSMRLYEFAAFLCLHYYFKWIYCSSDCYQEKAQPLEFALDCLAAMIIGSLVGIAIEDMEFSQNIRYAIIAISGMWARFRVASLYLDKLSKNLQPTFLLNTIRQSKGRKLKQKKKRSQ